MNRILITYASRYGSTAEIAQRIGEVLHQHGLTADALPVTEVSTLEGYSGVVIGSPVYSGEWDTSITAFVEAHAKTLRQLPVAIFTTALRLRDDSPAMRDSISGVFDTYRIMLEPVAIGLFAGSLDYSKLSSIVKLQLKSKNLPEGDFRDWEQIESWAESLVSLLAA